MNTNSIIRFTKTILLWCIVLSGVFWNDPCECKQVGNKLNIVTTTTPLASIAEDVGGNFVSVASIGSGDEDPHFIQAKPNYMMKAKKADLWIRIGLELEIGYEGLILQGSRNPRIQINTPGHLDASEGILKLEVPTEKIDRSMGDVHPMGNPHYWLDPYNGRIIAKNICQRLKLLDPEHVGDYDRNLAAFLSKLDNAMAGWVAKLKPFEHSKIVTYHRSWPYFANRFNLDVVAELEPKPGIPPGPGHILEVINTMKSEKAGVILMEPFYNRDDAEAVAKKTGAKVVVVPNAVNEQVKDYIAML
ncbi:MAG: metal ABC transporter substrate-binding protein, partial [Sedimentisphaerales bacterium]